MVDRGWLVPEDRDFRLTASGEDFFAGLGIDLDAARAKRRMFARQCLDWSERRPHLAGSPEASLAEHAFARGWTERTSRRREVSLAVADRNLHALAPAGELHRLAVLRSANQRREDPPRFGDRTSSGHWFNTMFIGMYTISALLTTRYPGP